MSEYTPTTNEIRADFITLHTRNFDSYTVGRSLTSEQEVYGDAFDRWLAEVERAAAAKALEEVAEKIGQLEHDSETFDQQVRAGHSVDRVQGYDLGVTTAAAHVRARAAEIREST